MRLIEHLLLDTGDLAIAMNTHLSCPMAVYEESTVKLDAC